MPQYMEWPVFLKWAQSTGIPILLSAALAILAEYWPEYQGLEKRIKALVMFGLCLGIGLLSATLGCAMGYQVWSFAGVFWPAIWSGVVAFGGATATHIKDMGK